MPFQIGADGLYCTVLATSVTFPLITVFTVTQKMLRGEIYIKEEDLTIEGSLKHNKLEIEAKF